MEETADVDNPVSVPEIEETSEVGNPLDDVPLSPLEGPRVALADGDDDTAVVEELSVVVGIDEITLSEFNEETKALLELLVATRLYTASRLVPPHASAGFPAHGVSHCAGSLGLTGMLSVGSPSPQ